MESAQGTSVWGSGGGNGELKRSLVHKASLPGQRDVPPPPHTTPLLGEAIKCTAEAEAEVD